MRCGWMGVLVLVLAAGVDAQITRTATFENYAPGTAFTSFTYPVSGITFSESTNPLGGFVIDGDPLARFNGSNYLTAAVGPDDGEGSYFGFTATLPAAADDVTIGVWYFGGPSETAGGRGVDLGGIVLEGFDSSGNLIAQSAVPNAPSTYTLEISSPLYQITTFKVVVTSSVFTAYDNISYTTLDTNDSIVPEPASFSLITLGLGLLGLKRRSSQ